MRLAWRQCILRNFDVYPGWSREPALAPQTSCPASRLTNQFALSTSPFS